VRLLLDEHGYSEARLQGRLAQAQQPGHRRQHHRLHPPGRAGRALLPFEQRVAQAMQRIHASARLDAGAAQMAGPPGQATGARSGDRPDFVNRAFASRADGGAKQLDTAKDLPIKFRAAVLAEARPV
jgi:type I restriction enzyme R subunit